ncbi:hypothetical protein FKG94_21055 [Exilibacterium tricleocarpae]|uniref:Sarcosine oxidase subunit gamma n=1 Tax=Exilibacterium tricleocarpae TaxID=2591008 RepID=A0A545SZW2_9GAMM|nr:sarcosine oxidase subunit gamma family protein [Exilibacterium tricleocarpae]TQV70514.1 hypothetical protein FKG94_21055 [Exilibacterium tricleocarpae]
MVSLTATSALTDCHRNGRAAFFENDGVTLEELPFLGMLRLQGPGADPAFCAQVAALAMPLSAPGNMGVQDATSSKPALRCHWLAPNEWLLVTAAGAEPAVAQSLAPALAGRLALVTPISDSRLALAASGPCAAELLSKGCALDLHRRQFMPGETTVTRFAKVAGMITRTGAERYELYVDRSQARYVWQWLIDAAGEFAV